MTQLDIVPHTRVVEVIPDSNGAFMLRIYEYGECLFEKYPMYDYDRCYLLGMSLLNRMHQLCPLREEGGIE